MGEEGENEENKKKSSSSTSAPLTQAQFLSWKSLKDAETSAKKTEASRKREEDISAGLVQMNGRELFKHEPWVFDNNLY
uniref:zinc finger CCCH domain-containing protein 15 homolog n=1 Tax=Erigeron canadensis TaxID=72917 RepID=UPI001CB916AD|nr:zinc finger CCCH domain-containing protein 15 homolog [Erigeron canadensis]